MTTSLGRLAALPDRTKVYCAHEYTQDNLLFALRVEPKNRLLQKWSEEVALLRAKGQPSLPTTIALEKAINPFLRCTEPSVIAAVKERRFPAEGPVSVFAALRKWKDTF
jgi:hydroxyacylglutathione hydrolase